MQAMLPQYRFESLLGRGGMGAVYKAMQVSLDRPVAIKVLPGDLIDDADANFVERFKNEARTTARMNHPAIVNVYDFGQTSSGLLYFVMEFIDGTDVARMIQAQGRLPPEHALAITAHVCDALNYAHTHGVIHRDIKPANILINMEGQVKVADFGLAKMEDPAKGSGLTKTGMAMGTPDFVAPEALVMGVNVDARADLYAIGVMLYNMLTGEIPRGFFELPSKKCGSDPRFDAIVRRAMEQDRERRYQSAAELRRDLDVILTVPMAKEKPEAVAAGAQAVQGGSQSRAPRKEPASPAASEAPKAEIEKPKSKGPLIGIAATAIAAAGLFFVFKPKPPPAESSMTLSPPSVVPPSGKAVAAVDSRPSPTPSPASVDSSAPSPLPQPVVKNSIDLLARTYAVRDRVTVPASMTRNEWVREGTALVYKSDGKAGKLAAPVAFECRDYEIELVAEKLSGDGRIHLDVPVGKGRILPLVLHIAGKKVINEKAGRAWPAESGPTVHVAVRVRLGGDGSPDRIVVQRKDNGESLADWSGSMDKLAKSGEAHPEFPDQPVASIFVMKDSYAVKTWMLRVFEGEARALRGERAAPLVASTPTETSSVGSPQSSMPAPADSQASAPQLVPGGINLLASPDVLRGKIEGDWTLENGELTGSGGNDFARIAFDAPVPAAYDFRIRFTRKSGNLAVAMHCPVRSRDVMWLMGGFSNSVHALETVNGALGNANPTTVKAGLENGQVYMANVKVRADRITVMLDGKVVVNYRTNGADLGVVDKWKFPDPAKLGVGCQRETVFHSIELIPFLGRETDEAAAMPPAVAVSVTQPVSFGGSRYQYVETAAFWPGANKTANEMKGDLVCITSAAEQEFIRATFGARLPPGTKVWTGAVIDRSGSPDWVSGEAFNYTNWQPSQPDGNGSRIVMVAPEMHWDDTGSKQFGFIVEWKDPPATLAAPPASPPDDPRLTQLDAGFKARFETDAQKPFLAAVAALNQSYVNNGIARARIAAQKNGALAEVTALDAEKTRVQNNEPLPSADLDDLPASLKQLRATYRTALAKIEADRAKKASPLFDIYLGALDAYITELTKANRIDEAQKAKAWRDQIAAQKKALSEGNAGAIPAAAAPSAAVTEPAISRAPGASASAASAGPMAPIPPEVLAPPQKGKHTPELIDWALKRKAFRIGYTQGNKRAQVTVSSGGKIPNGADLWLIDGGNQSEGDPFDMAWLEGQTELEQLLLWQVQKFESPIVLRGMKKLQVVRLQAVPTVLDEESMRFFPPLPELKQLLLDGAFSNQGLRIICERCPKLESLTLSQRFTQGGLLPLVRLKELRRLSIDRGEIAGADMKALAAIPNLEMLQLSRCKVSGSLDVTGLANLAELHLGDNLVVDGGVSAIAALKKLTSLTLEGSEGITDAAVMQLAPLTKLAFLHLSRCQLKDLGGAAMPVFPALESCHLHGNPELSDTACLGLAKQKNLRSLYLTGSAIGDAGLQAICENCRDLTSLWIDNTKITDAGVTALRRLSRLEKLRIGKTAITDAAVEHLRKMPTLAELFIRDTQISAQGMAALKKALPRCTVVDQ